MRLSIRYKILGVLGFLLIAAVCFYTALASLIFREEKIALLYDINHSLAVNASAQLRASLRQVSDQLRLFVLSQVLSQRSEIRLPPAFLQDSHVIGTRLFKKGPKELANDNLYAEIKTSGKLPTMTLERAQLVPLLKEAETNGLAFWSNTNGDVPRFFLVTKVEMRLSNETEFYFAVAEIEGKPFLETIQASNIFKSYLVKKNGEVLLVCEGNKISGSTSISDHPLLAKLDESKKTGALSYEYKGERWFGAYAPVGLGNLVFISQASRKEVMSAIRTLIERSALFGLIVITITFIASILFSKKLTRNLAMLTEGARQIGAGDLQLKIKIESKDEIQELATSFNAMVDALRASREAIEKYNRELEDKVAERTRQLKETNAQIKDVQEKLLKTTQLAAIGEVAGRTAHEVLNPLTAIISRLERSQGVVTSEGKLPDQISEILLAWEDDFKKGGMEKLTQSLQNPSAVHSDLTMFEEDLDNLKKLAHFWEQQITTVGTDLHFVQEQAHRIHRIVDSMRELIRSSVKADVKCHPALKEAVATMYDFIGKQGIKLIEEFTATKDEAHLNRDELIQIVTNLVRNGFQAILSHTNPSLRKKGQIKVCTTSTNHLFLIDVVDTGPGVPEDKAAFIFEHGFTTKNPKEGTGFGLSICRRYARAFGGEVDLLYSEPEGRGTCFRITIPLKEEASMQMAV